MIARESLVGRLCRCANTRTVESSATLTFRTFASVWTKLVEDRRTKCWPDDRRVIASSAPICSMRTVHVVMSTRRPGVIMEGKTTRNINHFGRLRAATTSSHHTMRRQRRLVAITLASNWIFIVEFQIPKQISS